MPDFTNRVHRTVDPHEVETGDIIVGTHQHVYSSVYDGGDGRWHFLDRYGRDITTASIEARISVWRDSTNRYLDWCDAQGIPRPVTR